MYIPILMLWLTSLTQQACLNSKRLYKRIETTYNKPNPWNYFQSDENGDFNVNARKPFLLAFWFKINFAELYEVIPVAFPCLGVENDIKMRLNSSSMLEIEGEEFFEWENDKWGFILISVQLAIQKMTLVISLLNSDGTLMTSYSSKTVALNNCYISFFAPNLAEFTQFNGVLEDITIYDKLISQKDLKLLLQEQEPRLRFYLDFSVSNGLVLPNLSHYLMKQKFPNYTMKQSSKYFVDSNYSVYNAFNGGSGSGDSSTAIPHMQDWILNQQRKYITLPTEILPDASSFSIYLNFDVIVKLSKFKLDRGLDTDQIDKITLYSRINSKDPRKGLDLIGMLSEGFNSEWQIPLTLGIYDRTNSVVDINQYIDFSNSNVIFKNYFVLVKVWRNRFFDGYYNVSLMNGTLLSVVKTFLAFTDTDQHYIGSIFKDSDGFSQIFEFKLNEFGFFENTLTVTDLICSEHTDSIRLGFGNSLEIGCKDGNGNLRQLKECAAGTSEPAYCSIPDCEICSLDGGFCIERKNGLVPVNEQFHMVWNFDNLVYDKLTKNVIKAIGNIGLSNLSTYKLYLDFPAKYSVLLVINMQIVVSKKDEIVDFSIHIDGEHVSTVNCNQSLSCSSQTINLYITIPIKITTSREVILNIVVLHDTVDYYVKNLKYALNRLYEKCDSNLVTDYKIKCSICSIASGAQYKYLPIANNYLYGECVEICPSEYYEVHNTCLKCPDNCPNCVSADVCPSCYNVLTYEPAIYDYGDSVVTSSYGSFLTVDSDRINFLASFYKKCVSCFDFCDNCETVPSNCLTCAKGYYADNDNNCLKCNSECSECKASKRTDCTKCVTGKYVSSTGACESCSTNCGTCEGTYNNCLTCNSEVAIMDEAGKCVGKEYTNMFLHKVLNLYEKCEDCTSCMQSSQVVCSRCPICSQQCGVSVNFIQSKIKIFEIKFDTIKTFANSNIMANLNIFDAITNTPIKYSIWDIVAPSLFIRLADNSYAEDYSKTSKVKITIQPDLINEAEECYITPIEYIYQITVNRNNKTMIVMAKIIFTITFVVGIILSVFNLRFLAFVVTIHHSIFILNFLLSLRSSDNSLLYELLHAMHIDFRAFDLTFGGLNLNQGLVDKYKFLTYNTIDLQEKYTIGFNLFHVLALILAVVWLLTWIKLNLTRYTAIRNAVLPIQRDDKKNKIQKINEIAEILFINVFMFYLPYQYLDYSNVAIKIVSDLGITYYGITCAISFLVYNYVFVIILIRYGNILRKSIEKNRPGFYTSAFSIFPVETVENLGLHCLCFFVSMVRHALVIFVQTTFDFSDFVSGFIVSFLNLFYFALLMNCELQRKIYYLQFFSEFVLFFMTYMMIFNDLIADQINWKDIIFWFFCIYAIYILIYSWVFYVMFITNYVKIWREKKRISPA